MNFKQLQQTWTWPPGHVTSQTFLLAWEDRIDFVREIQGTRATISPLDQDAKGAPKTTGLNSPSNSFAIVTVQYEEQ